jgi:hypothetical protein
MVLLKFVNSREITCNFSQPHIKYFQTLNSNKILFVITFLYITFAAIWTGPYYVLAVEYNSYVILKHCPFDSDECK